MVGWQVAIPSYKRADLLKERTLRVLAEAGIAADRITVFVANEEQRVIYEGVLDRGSYGKLVVAEPGIAPVRTVIARYYPNGAQVVSIDDDIQAYHEIVPEGKKYKKLPLKDVAGRFTSLFQAAQHVGARLWGLCYHANTFYAGNSPRLNLRLLGVCGATFGFVADHSLPALKSPAYVDMEITIQYFQRDRVVLRDNRCCFQQQAYRTPGGLQADGLRTVAVKKQAQEYLCSQYPMFCKPSVSAEGHPAVKVRDYHHIGKAF